MSTATEPNAARSRATPSRVRMTGKQRREQLLDVGRALFAERGFDGTSIEEIANRAKVSKPVVYEHFGGKEGLYAVVVDREMEQLLERITSALQSAAHPRTVLEYAALSLLDYIETSTDGFRILVRDSPVAQSTGGFAEPDIRRGEPGRAYPGRAVQGARLRTEARSDVRADAGGDGRADRAVVAGRPQAQEGRRRRSSGQPGMERTGGPGGQAAAGRP